MPRIKHPCWALKKTESPNGNHQQTIDAVVLVYRADDSASGVSFQDGTSIMFQTTGSQACRELGLVLVPAWPTLLATLQTLVW